MQRKIRWGILGCGRIARKFALDLKLVDDAELIAVGSRSIDNANTFAKDFPVLYTHGSYEALVQNELVDVIYIATPHSEHYQNTLLCLQHNKAVLCEKAFAVNFRQAKEMIDLAREKKVFLMEAVWTKFLPQYRKLQSILREGLLGDIKAVQINFGFRPQEPVPARMYHPALAGGSLLDIGIYNVFMALSILGKPDHIDAWMSPAHTGVDDQCAVLFRYNNGSMAQLFSSFATHMPTEAEICGTNGRIRLTHRFYSPDTLLEYYSGTPDSLEIIQVEKEAGHGYQHEAQHVCDCLQQGLSESPVMTHADSLLLMEMLDTIRKKAGIKYPVDEQ